MKICYVANARLPSEKAHPYQILKMCEAFVNNKIDVELILSYRVQTTKKLKQIKDIWKYYGISNRFKITKLPSFDLIWLDSYIGSFPFHLRSLFQATTYAFFASVFSLFKKTDVFYTRDRFFTFFFGLLKFLHKKKIYYEGHKFEPLVIKLMKKGWIDGQIVITKKLKDLYVKEGISEKEIFVAPDGVDLHVFDTISSNKSTRTKLGLPLGKKIIGYAGQLHTIGLEKGAGELIEAFRILINNEQINDVILCFVGGPENRIQKYTEFVKRKKLQTKVIFAGQKSPGEVPMYLKTFDVCIMPFPWIKHYAYYMSPLKLFEYMASKKPIVATDLPSVREILNEKNAILVEPGNPNALAEGIKKLLIDGKLAKKLAENAYSDVQQYTWEMRAERILRFIWGGYVH